MCGYTGTNRYPGKDVHVFLTEGTGEERFTSCNTIDYGLHKGLPENDKGEWFNIVEAKDIVMKSQESVINTLIRKLNL